MCTGVSYSEALGSARGLHSLGPSESSSEAGDLHLPGSEEGGLHAYDSRRNQAKLRRHFLGGDTLHEEVSSRSASVSSDRLFSHLWCCLWRPCIITGMQVTMALKAAWELHVCF